VSTGTALLLGLLLLVGNAFFVGSEFALLSAQRARVEVLASGGSRRARWVLRDMRRLTLLLAGTQLGITACSLGLGHVAEPAVARVLEGALGAVVDLPVGLSHALGFAVALSLVTVLHMVLGEMVPKNLALAGPERTALWLGPPMSLFTTLVRPFIGLLNGAANLVLRLFRITPSPEVKSAFTPAELAGVLAESRSEGYLDETGHELLSGALALDTLSARGLMLPRSELVTLPGDATTADLEDAVRRHGYSRYPLERAGELVGFVHVKDLLTLETPGEEALPGEWLRPLVTVAADLPLDDLLATMRAGRTHLAAVVDDDGSALGVVPLENVLEAFVGEISDVISEAHSDGDSAGRGSGGRVHGGSSGARGRRAG
jgi:CBS domain containing-hemolysin-like protein